MSLDEMLFHEYKNEPVLRIYYWNNAYTTIGYFQSSKNIKEKEFVRRFTGGLVVNHYKDISYSFVVSSVFWEVYDQHYTYKNIHFTIQKTLCIFGINSKISTENRGDINNICIKTICENDLISNGKKIVGSCLRRRGDKIIVQGSIHIDLDGDDRKIFFKEFTKNLAKILKKEIKTYSLSDNNIECAKKFAIEKYSNPQWNNKF
jgi:lipoate-protein ligase A